MTIVVNNVSDIIPIRGPAFTMADPFAGALGSFVGMLASKVVNAVQSSQFPDCQPAVCAAAKDCCLHVDFASSLENKKKLLFCSNDPGIHVRGKSPVYGSRHQEYKALVESSYREILLEFIETLYPSTSFRALIKKEDLPKCDPFAEEIGNEYIAKYASNNCTRRNIVKHVGRPLRMGSSGIFDASSQVTHMDGRLDGKAIVQTTGQEICIPQGDCMPHALVEIHEIMHAEELPYGNFDSFLKELLTTLKQHIYTDLVYRKCHGIDKDEVDYGKTISFDGRRFPAGELASFYGNLEKEYGTLSSALLSPKSIAYLMGDPKYETVLNLMQLEPGSKKAIEAAETCLANKDWKIQLIALPAIKALIQNKQYDLAFEMVMKGLENNQESRGKRAFIGIAENFIENSQSELALKILMKGLENSKQEIRERSFFAVAQALMDKKEYAQIFSILMKVLENSNVNIRRVSHAAIQLLIEEEQYDLAFPVIIKGLEDLDPRVRQLFLQKAEGFIRKEQYDPALKIIMKGLEDSDPELKKTSIEMIKELIKNERNEEAFKIIAETIKDTHWLVRASSLSLAKELIQKGYNLPEFLEFIQTTLKSSNSPHRWEALQLLKEISIKQDSWNLYGWYLWQSIWKS